MSSQLSTDGETSGNPALTDAVAAAFDARIGPAQALTAQAAGIVAAAYAMAARFKTGAKLLTFGIGGASADASHVAVEFVHPVIVGKRALPAISLTSDLAAVTGIAASSGLAEVFAYQLRMLAEPADIALGIATGTDCPSVRAGLLAAAQAGLLTVALTGGAGPITADHVLTAEAAGPSVVKEIHVTMYHLLWELVHVFIEQPAVLQGGTDGL